MNGNISFLFDAMGGPPAPRPALPGDRSADVCIVGGGLTGLWTAYYLKQADPSLDIVIVEREDAGLIAGPRDRFAKLHGEEAVRTQQRLMNEAVDEIVNVAAAEGISADIVKGGTIRIASSPVQVQRLRAGVEEDHHWGVSESRLLEPDELNQRIRMSEALRAAY